MNAPVYMRIYARFRDLEDVVNHRQTTRDFVSPIFRKGNSAERKAAVLWLVEHVRKEGFTHKELLKRVEAEVPSPFNFHLDDPATPGLSSAVTPAGR